MQKQSGYTLFELILVILFVAIVISWVVNLVKFSNCDFKEDYKCEIVHAVGILPPAALVTAWVPSDED